MHKPENYLQQAERHICEAGWHVTRQELIAKLAQGGHTTARPRAAMLAGLDASWAHRRALLRRN